ncbi:MAG: RNA methyltransferase [Endozoicomonas sp. (ex Botrylloides leachii)]|nr:RNA methyltransferase [Endozoicomonas sp. (ex Botrylloides leachii)]
MLDNLTIVLVNPSHPGNIGSTARAMKTMGLSKLCLVNPDDFPSDTAMALASGANDILEQAQVVSSLDEAIGGYQFVVGTSARVRGVSLPLVDPRSCAKTLIEELSQGAVALVFGREDRGLTNQELTCCHLQVHIPTNPDFSSLNLGAAVQVLCYELRMAGLLASEGVVLPKKSHHELATVADMERFYGHLYEVLLDIGFLEHSSHEKIMRKLRRLYGRIRLDRIEIAILRGILSETKRCIEKGQVS